MFLRGMVKEKTGDGKDSDTKEPGLGYNFQIALLTQEEKKGRLQYDCCDYRLSVRLKCSSDDTTVQ